ncbi:heme exporter protein CcmD [Pelomonas sp. APW6]|uniref:Heme exporter protein D n=1 Tax=Roseateles subflavus TaxID=3053353 RepID=A0ABT7LFU5_9BURK|nr:heme exporter protein CcmD [Pelomonas sp. APW6]MDL5031717.1 heme exporter protein CcmD [Pelomonas sp. APW6]
MDMHALMQWLSLKGYGLYVWPAYGLSLLAIAVEMARVRRRLSRALSPLGDTEPTQQELA